MVTGFPILTVLWLVPLAGAGAVAVVPVHRRALAKSVGLSVALITLAVTLTIVTWFDPVGAQYQFTEHHRWIPAFGAGYLLGVDGIALALVVLAAVLVPVLLLAGWNDTTSPRAYIALILVVESTVLVSLIALDVLLFFVFFEAMLVPMYFLIGAFGSTGSARAALKFLLYGLFSGLVMLAAVIGLYVVTARSTMFGSGTFDFRAIVAAVSSGQLGVNPAIMNALFLGFMLPLWPFHTWLPGAAAEATPVTAVLMMAVVDKVGTFGMLRYCLQLFPDASTLFRPFIITLAVIGIVYGAILAIGQTDVMRLIA
ncbi:NADH-quinone oxidoreductase subunit M, partial [Mycolicibacterium komossense]